MIELKKAKKNINYDYPIENGELVDILLTCNKKIIPLIVKNYDILNNNSIIRLFNTEYSIGNDSIRKRIELIEKIALSILQ